MNCPNCAAPLSPVPGRTLLTCAHCGALHAVAPPDGSVDRVIVLGDVGDALCPVCRQGLVQAAVEGYPALQCPGCAGLLLTNDDFAMVVRLRRAACERPSAGPQPLDAESLQRATDCPTCGKRMETHPYYGPGNQVIDSCSRCKVLWLDSGELTAIERAPGRNW